MDASARVICWGAQSRTGIGHFSAGEYRRIEGLENVRRIWTEDLSPAMEGDHLPYRRLLRFPVPSFERNGRRARLNSPVISVSSHLRDDHCVVLEPSYVVLGRTAKGFGCLSEAPNSASLPNE